jgi:hypothetical protein
VRQQFCNEFLFEALTINIKMNKKGNVEPAALLTIPVNNHNKQL